MGTRQRVLFTLPKGPFSPCHFQSNEVTELRQDVAQLKQVVAELVLENRLLKKSVTGFDSEARA